MTGKLEEIRQPKLLLGEGNPIFTKQVIVTGISMYGYGKD